MRVEQSERHPSGATGQSYLSEEPPAPCQSDQASLEYESMSETAVNISVATPEKERSFSPLSSRSSRNSSPGLSIVTPNTPPRSSLISFPCASPSFNVMSDVRSCNYNDMDNPSGSDSMMTNAAMQYNEGSFISPSLYSGGNQTTSALRHGKKCPFEGCKAVFGFESQLNNHLRKHTKEKPYVCPTCEYRSSYKGNLNAHIKKYHNIYYEG